MDFLCALTMRRVFIGARRDVTTHMVVFLTLARPNLTFRIEATPAYNKAEREAIKASRAAVLGESEAEEKGLLRNYYGWRNVRDRSMYAVHCEGASDCPHLFLHFDDTSKGPTNEITTRACIGGIRWLVRLTGKCIRGLAVVLRQGEGTSSVVIERSPMMAILSPSRKETH